MTKTNLADHSARAHADISPSSFDRTLNCTASVMAASKYPPQDTTFTREGTVAHEVVEAVCTGKEVLIGGEITEEMVTHAKGFKEFRDGLLTTDDAVIMHEVRCDMSDEVPGCFGTADCVLFQDKTLIVIDYKYGKGVEVSAVGNAQMRLYAFGAMKELDFIYDIEHVQTYIYQPRIGNISTETLTKIELLDWISNEAIPAAREALSGKGKYHAGEHCRFCPHAGKCRELAKSCVEKIKWNGKNASVVQLAPWEIADIISNKKVVENWLKKVEEQALTDLMNGKEIPGYKVVEGRVGNRTYTNEIEVFDHLLNLGLAEEDITKTVLITPADLDKMLGKKEAAKALEGYVTRSPGKPTLAPESDKRPVYDKKAELIKEFEEA